MSSLLVIRLHPVEPITGDEFTNYLNGLSITAYDASLNDPHGSESDLGKAAYIAPTLPAPDDPDPNPIQDPTNGITQHFDVIPGPVPDTSVVIFFAIATAVIEFEPPVGGEYKTADVRLVITRKDGNEDIEFFVHKPIYYNVPVAPGPIPPDPNNFPNISDPPGVPVISLHLALPSSAQPSPTVVLPEDGTTPNFANLLKAVEEVLNEDPGNTDGIADLTVAQCRHIAYEIIWDRMAYPIPLPKRSLEEIYTGPHPSDSDQERDRRIFEGDLLTYYTKHNTEAERLKTFIFSLSAAMWCEEKSINATQAGFDFPVFPNPPKGEAKVILKASGTALDPVHW